MDTFSSLPGHRAPNSPQRASTRLQTGILGLHGLHQLRKRGFEGRRQLPSRSALMLWRMAQSSHSPSVWPLDGRQRSPRFWPRPSPADGPRSRPRPFFGNSRHRLNPFNEKQCIIKKWSTQAYQKAARFGLAVWAQMVGAGCGRKASCSPARLAKSGGRVSRRRSRSRQPGATHSPQGEHGEDCSTHRLTRRYPQLNKPTSGRQAVH